MLSAAPRPGGPTRGLGTPPLCCRPVSVRPTCDEPRSVGPRTPSTRRAPLRRLVWIVGVLTALLLGPTATARGAPAPQRADPERGEHELKAAFLYNFIRYTTWPRSSFENSRSPIVLTVVGTDPFGETLESTFKDKRLHGRSVEIKRHKRVPKGALHGHLIFAASLSAKDRKVLLERCADRAMFVVGEAAGFGEQGACANFFLEDQRIRFEMNPGAIRKARIDVSSELLKLARIVETKGVTR